MSQSNKQTTETSQDTKTLVTVLLLIFIFPVGLIVMWAWSNWKLWVKLLITLIVVMPLVGILFSLGLLLTIDPGEQIKRARDTERLNNMVVLQEAINTSLSKYPNQLLCGGEQPPCFYTSDDNSPTATKTDESGWFPLKLDSLTQLPKDPQNNKDYYYLYCSDGKDWEINAFFESKEKGLKMKSDGGDDPEVYEIGSNLKLCQYSD